MSHSTRRHGIINLFPRPPIQIPPSPPPSLSSSSSSSSPDTLRTPPVSDDDHTPSRNRFKDDDTCWFDSPDSDDDDDVIAWYARELGDIVSLHTPLPTSFPTPPPARPESVFPPPHKRHTLNRRSSVALHALAFPSTQLDPTYPSLRRVVIPSRPPPPPPIPHPTPNVNKKLPLSPCPSTNSNTGTRPPPRTSLPADVADTTSHFDFDFLRDLPRDASDPFNDDDDTRSIDSCSVYSQDDDLEPPSALRFSSSTFFPVTITTTITTTTDPLPTDPDTRRKYNVNSPPPLRSRWSSSTLASTSAGPRIQPTSSSIPASSSSSSSPSSRLRAYLTSAARKSTPRLSTAPSTKPAPLSIRKKSIPRGSGLSSSSTSSPARSSAVANVVGGWAPALLGVRRSGSRASAATTSSSSGHSHGGAQSDDSLSSAGLRRKPIPVEMFLRGTC